MTSDSAIKVCGDQSVDQVLNQQLTRLEEESKGRSRKSDRTCNIFGCIEGTRSVHKVLVAILY
jgi:hypothetical protein